MTKLRGEVWEIRAQLQMLVRQGNKPENIPRRREVARRVIQYTSMGLDMSPIFMDVVKHAASTTDLVIRKLMHLYVSTYASARPDLALLTINILTKDCANPDPAVRSEPNTHFFGDSLSFRCASYMSSNL